MQSNASWTSGICTSGEAMAKRRDYYTEYPNSTLEKLIDFVRPSLFQSYHDNLGHQGRDRTL